MSKEYRVLTLWEPWATLLVHGIKKIETRPSATNWTIEKGGYLIHAAQKWSKETDAICNSEPFNSELNKLGYYQNTYRGVGGSLGFGWKETFNYGHIIGAVDITECCEIQKDFEDDYFCLNNDQTKGIYFTKKEISFGDYREGRYAWIMDNPRLLKTPIPYKGGQGYYQRFKGDVSQLKFK